MSRYTYRLATEEDSPRILDLYAYYVRDTVITFEYEVPSAEVFRARVAGTATRYPYLLCEAEDGTLAGFSYASPYKERAAYAWSVEISVYVDAKHQRRGLARAMYQRMFAILRLQGCRSAFACITHPNEPSERFHASLGFEAAGLFRRAGFKLGQWRDVAWMQKSLLDPWSDPDAPPTEIRAVSSLDPDQVERILRDYSRP